MNANDIYLQASEAIEALANENRPHFNPMRLLVVGCSSSEIAGGVIGHQSTYEYGEAVAKAAVDQAKKHGFSVAFQCCEHLNRSLAVERSYAEAHGLEIVCAVPRKKAGGSLATAAWKLLEQPCLVSEVHADAAIDIGLTLIGMHLRRVAVPVRLPMEKIGNALISAARTRPALIGGERACYTEED